MKSKFITRAGYVLVVVIIIVALSFTSKNKLSIDGAWSFVEVQIIKSDGTFTSTFPKEGIAIFSHNYYTFCWTSHVSAVHSWQMADSEKLNRFNQSIINTGTFELKDSILTTDAKFALNPMFTNGLATFKCSLVGDTLVLTGLNVYSSDKIPHPIYANGSHIVTKLLKVRTR